MRFHATEGVQTWQRSQRCWVLLGLIAVMTVVVPGRVLSQETAPEDDSSKFAAAVQLLPTSTQGFVELRDMPRLIESWRQTSLADLQHDPAMQKFLESQRDAIEEKLSELGVRAGLRLSDMREAISGELVFAWMKFDAPERPFAVAMLADTRGRDEERKALLEKVDNSLKERGATVSTTAIRGFQATVYNLPQKKGQLGVEKLGVVEINGRIIISDRVETLAGLVSAAIDGRQDSIETTEEYRQVFEHESLQKEEIGEDGQPLPMVRWFARPIEMGMIMRELAGVDRGNQVDILALLKDQGFDVLRAVGGHLYLATEHYDLVHRGYFFAPPTGTGDERYTKAARMLQFPNEENWVVPKWVPAMAASYFHMKWETQEAFWAMEPLVDQAFGSEVFRPMLEDLRDSEGLDVADGIVARFQDSFLIVTDNTIVGSQMRERVVGAVPLDEPEEVARILAEALQEDPDIFRYEYPHHQIWEVRIAETEDIEFGVDSNFDFGFEEDDQVDNVPRTEPLLERWGFTVYDGYLMFASHAEMLADLIDQAREGNVAFEDQEAFARVREAIVREGGQVRSMERIWRSELTWRIKYDLIREGKFLDSDSLLASLIRRMLERAEQAESEESNKQTLKIDMTQLPPFKSIQHHMQPGGGFLKTTDEGWELNQFLLRKPAKAE